MRTPRSQRPLPRGAAARQGPLENIFVDARAGVFETTMVNDADGSQYSMHAIFSEVAEPERLVWTEPASGVTTTSTFRDLGGTRTEVAIRQRNVPPLPQPRGAGRVATSLDRFASYLGKLSGESA